MSRTKRGPTHNIKNPLSDATADDAAGRSVRRYGVSLQLRHAEWIDKQAIRDCETAERVIEKIIRAAYARDPYKAGPPQVGGSFMARDLAEVIGS